MRLLRSIATAIVSAVFLSGVDAHSQQRNPIRYLSSVENAAFHTPSNRVNALSDFSVTFDLHGGKRRVKLILAPNHDVISDGATISYLSPDGSLRHAEPVDRSEYRVFKGKTVVQRHENAEWENVGWARILVHRDGKHPLFEGAFRVDGDHHHIQTTTHYMETRHKLDPMPEHTDGEHMVVWRDSDIMSGLSEDSEGRLHRELKRSLSGEHSCSADKLTFNTQHDHPVYRDMRKREDKFWGSSSTRSIFGRQIDGQTFGNSAGVNLANTIGQTTGCPTTRKVALVGIATDCTYTAAFNSTASARANIIAALNTASTQYEDAFNITLGLQNLTISDAACPATEQAAAPWNIGCSDGVTIQNRLNLFSAWRGQRADNNAYWTLLSTCPTGSAVGLAWLGQACVNTAQPVASSEANETVTGANVVVRTSTEWQVIAHETGHTFGAVHDCTTQSCADGMTVASQQCCPLSATTCDAGGQYIMNPSTGANIQQFSPCTIGNICAGFARNSVKTNCLLANKDVTIITGSQCGNGIVESGEDCDCGGESGCGDNPCCNPTTCKFKDNSVCDPSNEDCCTRSCQFAGSGTVCRASTGVCDPQEVCSGTAATCPPDETAPPGTSCGNSTGLECSSGQCTSRDLQCKSIMGSFTQGNDTYACSHSGCQISCASPEFGSNVCYKMQQNFLDGTSCQGGGRCSNGNCQGASVGKEIQSWVNQNKTLVIALSSVIGGLVVIAILSCIISRCRRRSLTKARKNKPISPGWQGPPPVNQWNYPPVPNAAARRLSSRDPGWGGQDPNPGWRPPPPTWQPQPSVRYA